MFPSWDPDLGSTDELFLPILPSPLFPFSSMHVWSMICQIDESVELSPTLHPTPLSFFFFEIPSGDDMCCRGARAGPLDVWLTFDWVSSLHPVQSLRARLTSPSSHLWLALLPCSGGFGEVDEWGVTRFANCDYGSTMVPAWLCLGLTHLQLKRSMWLSLVTFRFSSARTHYGVFIGTCWHWLLMPWISSERFILFRNAPVQPAP